MTTPTFETPAAPASAVPAPSRTLSVLSLVAAVASIPLGHFFVLPIAAIVLGFVARSREPWGRNLSTWGIILGFVVLFGWIIIGAIAASVWLWIALLHHSL